MSKRRGPSGPDLKRQKATRILVIMIVVIMTLGSLVGVIYINKFLGKVNRTSTDPDSVVAASQETFEQDAKNQADTASSSAVKNMLKDVEVMQDDAVKNYLLIGQDERSTQSERQRSDSMIICSINCRTKKIILTSLMRDMYVSIPGYSDNRLNATYQLGGMELLDETIEMNFGVHIDGNFEVNFDGFLQAMSVVGNLDISLTQEEADWLNAHTGYGEADDQAKEEWNLHAGVNSLTPAQALAYSRTRYVGNSDYDRTERQRKVLMTAFKKIMSEVQDSDDDEKETNLGVIISKILPYVTTDLDDSEILSAVKTIVADDITTIESYRIPTDDGYTNEVINQMEVLLPNLPLESAYLQYYIYGGEKPDPDNYSTYSSDSGTQSSTSDGTYAASNG